MVKWWFGKACVCGTSLCVLQGPYRLWTHGPGMWPLVFPSKKDFYKCDRFSRCFDGSLLVNQWTFCWIDLKLWVPGRSNLVWLKVDPIHVMSSFLSLTVCWTCLCRHETSTCWTILDSTPWPFCWRPVKVWFAGMAWAFCKNYHNWSAISYLFHDKLI